MYYQGKQNNDSDDYDDKYFIIRINSADYLHLEKKLLMYNSVTFIKSYFHN